MVGTVSFTTEAVSRGARMLRTGLGPAIAAWLEDPAVVEVMLNPDGRLWIDCLTEGLAGTGKRLSVGSTSSAGAQAVSAATADYRPTDPQIAWHLARFVENVHAVPADPVIVRQNWLAAYDFITDRGAVALNDFARVNNPFAKVGKIQVVIDISSVIRASNDSFRVAWVERR